MGETGEGMLPAFNSDGNLPEGIHRATAEEVFGRFATTSARRQWLGEQLRSLLTLAQATGQLSRVFLWGSFVTSKEVPNDVDVFRDGCGSCYQGVTGRSAGVI